MAGWPLAIPPRKLSRLTTTSGRKSRTVIFGSKFPASSKSCFASRDQKHVHCRPQAPRTAACQDKEDHEIGRGCQSEWLKSLLMFPHQNLPDDLCRGSSALCQGCGDVHTRAHHESLDSHRGGILFFHWAIIVIENGRTTREGLFRGMTLPWQSQNTTSLTSS